MSDPLPARLRALREQAGLSVADLAKRLGVTRQTVYAWESGTSAPTWDAVRRLADLFGVTTDHFRS